MLRDAMERIVDAGIPPGNVPVLPIAQWPDAALLECFVWVIEQTVRRELMTNGGVR
jgi:hypothetical protein